MSTKEQYDAFLEACEELKSSKIILADAKVSNVLRSIVACPTLVEVVGETLVGYNFNGELESINKNDAGIVMPSEPYRVIAFVFSLLSEIDAGRLDLQEFVDDYFVAETLAQKFDRFNQELITPFRDFLCSWAGAGSGIKKITPQNNASQETVEEENIQEDQTFDEVEECGCTQCEGEPIDMVDEFFADVEVILNQIKDTVCLDSKIKSERQADINITLNAMLDVVSMQNFRIFNALLISLNNLLNNIKSVRFYFLELQNKVADFYLK